MPNIPHLKSPLGERIVFTSYYHKGKKILPALCQNEFFKSLFAGHTSIETLNENPQIILKTFVNRGTKISDTVSNGKSHFKIHDFFFHRSDDWI